MNGRADLQAFGFFFAPDLPHDAEACRSCGAVDHESTGEVDHPKLGEPSTWVPDPGRGQCPDEHKVNDRIDRKGGQLHLVKRDYADQSQSDRGEGGLEKKVSPSTKAGAGYGPPAVGETR